MYTLSTGLMSHRLLILSLSTGLVSACGEASDVAPYTPNVADYAGCITPSHVSQADLNRTVLEFYRYWKEVYVTPAGSTC